MADVLENERDLWHSHLSAQEIVVVVAEFVVREMVPSVTPKSDLHLPYIGYYIEHLRARITVQQSLSLHELLSVLATLAFEGLMRLAQRLLIEQEQFTERVEREMALDVLFLVHDGRRQRLLVRLSLEDLFLDRSRRDEAIHET